MDSARVPNRRGVRTPQAKIQGLHTEAILVTDAALQPLGARPENVFRSFQVTGSSTVKQTWVGLEGWLEGSARGLLNSVVFLRG